MAEDDGGTAALLHDMEADAAGIDMVVGGVGHGPHYQRSTALVNTTVLR